MIKHIYLFRLKDPSMREEVAAKLRTLKEQVPQILELEIGTDFKGAANSYDLCEYITFRTMEDYLAFGSNAYHASIRTYMAGVQESGIKIDYETNERSIAE